MALELPASCRRVASQLAARSQSGRPEIKGPTINERLSFVFGRRATMHWKQKRPQCTSQWAACALMRVSAADCLRQTVCGRSALCAVHCALPAADFAQLSALLQRPFLSGFGAPETQSHILTFSRQLFNKSRRLFNRRPNSLNSIPTLVPLNRATSRQKRPIGLHWPSGSNGLP